MVFNKLLYVCPVCLKPVQKYWAWVFRAFNVVICSDCTSEDMWKFGAYERDKEKEYKK